MENVNIVHTNYRRTHAFVYKTAFKDLNNLETILLNTIDFDDAAEKDMKVEKPKFIANTANQLGVAQGYQPITTGPILLPVTSNEKEATYKIRILGRGNLQA